MENFFKSIWKGVKAFLIAIAIVILGGVVQALSNFQPDPGIQTQIWSIAGALVIGLVTSAINWLKNKNTITTVKETEKEIVITSVKPK